MRIIILSLLAMAILSTGTTANAQEKKVVAEEVVAIVGNLSVSMSELYQVTQNLIEHRKKYGVTSKLQPAEEALESLLEQKLLTAYAKMDSLDKNMPASLEENVQKKVDDMVKKAGSIKELEKMTGKAIFQLRIDYKTEAEENMLAQMKQRDIRSKVTITHSEVADFFKTLNTDSLPPMPPQLSFAQIVKMPPATDERKYEVRQRLLGFRERIMNGERLEVLARLYSQDLGTKKDGGEFKNSYNETVSAFSEAVKSLNRGQISEIVETEYGFHLIEVISKTETSFVVRHILLRPEFTLEESNKVTHELDSIATLIRTNKITFAEASMRHSDDVESKMNGGLSFNTDAYYQSGDIREASSRYFLDQLNPADSRTLSKMKVGDVSDPYQNMDKKGNTVYKIVTVTELIPSHKVDMIEDFVIIENIALNQKQEKTVNDWVDKSISEIYIQINPEYMNYNFKREGWKKQSEKYTIK